MPTPNQRDYKGAPGRGCQARGGHQSSLPAYIKTSTNLTDEITPASPSSQGDFLASLSALPGSKEARLMTVTSGLRCLELSKRQGPLGSLVRMCLGSSQWNSTIAYLDWKPAATKSNRLLFRLVPWTQDIEGTGFGFLPTPQTFDSLEMTRPVTMRGKSPRIVSNNGVEGMAGLRDVVKMWPTPQAQDDRDRGNLSLPSIQRRQELGKQLNLSMVADPKSGALNPEWVEWLMGYPSGHTALKDWAMPSSRKSLNHSSTGSGKSNKEK